MDTKAGPWRLTGFALAQLALLAPTLVVFVVVVVGAAFSVLTVGIPVLMVGVPALRWLTTLHRSMASQTLGHPLIAVHLPTTGQPPIDRLRTWGRDPMTWRELSWCLVSLTVGFALALLTVLLLVLLVTGALWWFGAPHIMRARAVVDRILLSPGHTETLEQRVVDLTVSRAETVDHSAAELRRIERDLHDGAQARLVALGMTLGMADQAFAEDPETARRLVNEARDTTRAALGDLRSLVRGIHPPVLADRGLGGAVEALALDMVVPVSVQNRLDERPPAPVESAAYFAIAECLTNVAKHSTADHAWVELARVDGRLRATVGDDGAGGADPHAGTGMRGVAQRLAAFDGTMKVSSPRGGPTLVTLEVPCASSSPKTTPSSATA